MQVFIDRIKDKVFVKVDGIVSEASISKRELTNTVIEVDANQVSLSEATAKLISVIADAKEKAELVELGIESTDNLQLKITEYNEAKSAYNEAKANVV